nr:11S globulin seed storage protein 2-like [Ipomoea trifida]
MASLYFFVYALALLDSLATNWAHSLAPQKADQTIYEGEGGGYYTWSTSGAPFLSQAKLGAGKLVLQPNGFVLPHYTDAKRIGYVLQEMVFNLENASPFANIKNGGSLVSATAGNFPLLNDVGLSVFLVKLEPKSMLTPGYTADASFKLCYVSRGSARIQIVGLNGQLVLDDKVEAGQLFVVPKFFSASLIADKEGLELVATLTSSEPILGNLAGYGSVWKALSPSILKASLNLSMEDEDIFKAKIAEATIIIPPNIN